MAVHAIAPVPRDNAVVRWDRLPPKLAVDALAWLLSDPWSDYWDAAVAIWNRKPTRIHDVELEDQAATVSATDITDGTLAAGLYRISYYLRISRAASVSSSAQVSIVWTDNGVAQTETFAAVTGNATTSHQVGSMLLRVDKSAPVTYSITYGSVGGTPMQFYFTATLEYVKS